MNRRLNFSLRGDMKTDASSVVPTTSTKNSNATLDFSLRGDYGYSDDTKT